MSGLVLHDFELDDGCYTIRLMLSILGLAYEKIPVDAYPGQEHKNAVYRRLNPLGTLPILSDDALVLGDTTAILVYLARRYDAAATWLPADAAPLADVMAWLSFAARTLASASLARTHHMLDGPGDPQALDRAARQAFRRMEDHMTHRLCDGAAWFVGDGPTSADVALFPPIALSRDFGIDHDDYPALRRWMRRVRAIKGFVSMPGIPDYY